MQKLTLGLRLDEMRFSASPRRTHFICGEKISCSDYVVCYGDSTYAPMERSPDWSLHTGNAPSPTIYESTQGVIKNTRPIADGEDFVLMNTALGEVVDADMSCKIHYVGSNTHYGTYVMAKGRDMDNFVGVTSYNNEIMVYERVNGAWRKIFGVPNAGTLGAILRLTIIGTTCELFINGESKGTGSTNLQGSAHLGILIREHPVSEVLVSDHSLVGGKHIVTYLGVPVTYNSNPVIYN